MKKTNIVVGSFLLALVIVTVACENPSSSSPSTIAVTGVALTPSSLSLVVGAQGTLIASISPESASDRSVTWTSDDPGVASVSGEGIVTALAVGNTTITVTTTDGSHTDTCAVAVTGNTTVFADQAAFEAVYGENGINRFEGGSRGGTVVSYTQNEWETQILPAGGASWVIQYLDASAFTANDTNYRFGLGQHSVRDKWMLIFNYPDGTYRDFILTESQVNAMIHEMDTIFDEIL
jgi:hypothetical protein